jgi:hypothetical protein
MLPRRYSLREMRCGGVLVREAKAMGCSLREIKAAGYAEGVKAAGFTCSEAKAACVELLARDAERPMSRGRHMACR